jgi:hypothetical protein
MSIFRVLLVFLKYCWAFPVTCLGLAFIPLALVSGGAVSLLDGVLEVEGGLLNKLLSRISSRFSIDALTLGHVILGQNLESLSRCRDHERIHVRQYERWGPVFPFLYLLSSGWAWMRGRDPYAENRFEKEAFRRSDSDGI